VTDLFVYDLERSRLRRLTRDAFADIQPAWSPDGRRIAFTTDRFTSDVDALTFGAYRLALIDVADGTIQRVHAFADGKHINPQWSPDGESLYFVSDSDGTSNLYRIELAHGEVAQLTTVAAGISGLSPSSPVLSVATQTGVVALTIYRHGRFAIHTLTPGKGESIDVAERAQIVRLPPVKAAPRKQGRGWFAQAPAKTPGGQERVSKYRPRLSLEGVSQATFGVGADRFGGTAGGGVGLAFSDLLNTHWLLTAVQVNGGLESGFSLRDTSAFGAYLNQAHRWNWGLIGSYTPSLVGIQSTPFEPSEGLVDPAIVTFIRQTERAATVLASYPFDRARRVEFQGGVNHLTFDQASFVDVSPVALDQATFGETDEIVWTVAATPLTLSTVSAAFVSDTTSAGATSIVRGERYRLEIAPTLGTITYVNVLADYRRYFMPVPFYTIATRGLHFGRYGSGAEDPRVPALYLGYPTLVRGYDLDSRVESECIGVLARGCDEMAGLLGSRVAVGNVELRFPLLRPFGMSSRMYGPVPVEVAFFVDGGLAWRAASRSLHSRTGNAVWSTGITLRTSVIGLGLGQFDIARPFPDSSPGWVFQFNLAPAF
jgi:hypothetical protein